MIDGKKFIVFSALIVCMCCIAIVLQSQSRVPQKQKSGKIIVVTTLFPLYDIARQIGGDAVEVKLLLPPGVEAHAFNPTPQDMMTIESADIFIFTGKFMEPWVDKVLGSIANKNIVVVDASIGTKQINAASHTAGETEGSIDPHIWLDVDNMNTMVDSITRAVVAKDPKNSVMIEPKSLEYKAKLAGFDESMKRMIPSCASKEIIYGGHYAFGYFATRYGLLYTAAQGLAPDSEPTVQDLTALVDQIRKEKIRYVYYEELSSPKVAEVLASETGASLLLLNAGHNISKTQLSSGTTFLDILQADKQNIQIGLECK